MIAKYQYQGLNSTLTTTRKYGELRIKEYSREKELNEQGPADFDTFIKFIDYSTFFFFIYPSLHTSHLLTSIHRFDLCTTLLRHITLPTDSLYILLSPAMSQKPKFDVFACLGIGLNREKLDFVTRAGQDAL